VELIRYLTLKCIWTQSGIEPNFTHLQYFVFTTRPSRQQWP
jgi:hypothetical protein